MWEVLEAMARLASNQFFENSRPGNDAVNRPEACSHRIYLVAYANQLGTIGMRQLAVDNETFPADHGRQFVDYSNTFGLMSPFSKAIKRIAFGIEWQDTVNAFS